MLPESPVFILKPAMVCRTKCARFSISPPPTERKNRLDLAKWMVSRENPLTARVFVNRLWKLYFGTGISKTLDDFGARGEWPTHPELLDWLACEFMGEADGSPITHHASVTPKSN